MRASPETRPDEAQRPPPTKTSFVRRLVSIVPFVLALVPGCTATIENRIVPAITAATEATATVQKIAVATVPIEAPRARLDLAFSLVEPELFVHVPVIGKRFVKEIIAPRPPPISTAKMKTFDLAGAFVREDTTHGKLSADELRTVLRCEVTMADAAYGDAEDFGEVCGMKLAPRASNPFGHVWTHSSETTETVVMTIAGTKHSDDIVADMSGSVLADLASLDDAQRAPRTAPATDDGDLRFGLGWGVRWGQTGAPWWRDVVEPLRVSAATSRKHLDLVILGHSLGAAAAQLGAFLSYRYLRERAKETGSSFHVRATTFGSPSLGNEPSRTAYQRALAEGCDGRVCFSLHQFENHPDLVHDMPGAGFVHPVWQTDNTSATFGAGESGHVSAGDKSMYYARPSTSFTRPSLAELMGFHLMRFWHDEVARVPDAVLVQMGYL